MDRAAGQPGKDAWGLAIPVVTLAFSVLGSILTPRSIPRSGLAEA
jgi:hypothetical protein